MALTLSTDDLNAIASALHGRPTIYVRKTGNDTTGDGSLAAPYLTITKAKNVCASGDAIDIGPGVYAEGVDFSAKSNLLIRGSDRVGTVIRRTTTGITLKVGSGFTIKSLKLEKTGSDTTDIALYANSPVGLKVSDVWMSSEQHALQLDGASGPIEIEDVVAECQGYGIAMGLSGDGSAAIRRSVVKAVRADVEIGCACFSVDVTAAKVTVILDQLLAYAYVPLSTDGRSPHGMDLYAGPGAEVQMLVNDCVLVADGGGGVEATALFVQQYDDGEDPTTSGNLHVAIGGVSMLRAVRATAMLDIFNDNSFSGYSDISVGRDCNFDPAHVSGEIYSSDRMTTFNSGQVEFAANVITEGAIASFPTVEATLAVPPYRIDPAMHAPADSMTFADSTTAVVDSGLGGGATGAIFTERDDANGLYLYDPNCWPLRTTPQTRIDAISVWADIGYEDGNRRATASLVSDHYAITAWHIVSGLGIHAASEGVTGTKFRFATDIQHRDQAGHLGWYEGEVTELTRIGSTDICVLKLQWRDWLGHLCAGGLIAPLKIMPAGWSSLIGADALAGVPVLKGSRTPVPGLGWMGIAALNVIEAGYVACKAPDSAYSAFYRESIDGDSGQPICCGDTLLATLHFGGAGSGPDLSAYIGQINAVMDGEQLTIADLSDFLTFHATLTLGAANTGKTLTATFTTVGGDDVTRTSGFTELGNGTYAFATIPPPGARYVRFAAGADDFGGCVVPIGPEDVRQEIDANSTKLDVAVSSRLPTDGYTAPDNASITSIKAKTDNLPASPAATGDIPSASTIATAVWATLISGLTTAGSIGKWLLDQIAAVAAKTGLVGSNDADSPAAKTAQATIAANLDGKVSEAAATPPAITVDITEVRGG